MGNPLIPVPQQDGGKGTYEVNIDLYEVDILWILNLDPGRLSSIQIDIDPN